MLVLTRQPDETVIIGGNIEITVVHVPGLKIRLGISALPEVSLYREEVWKPIQSAGLRRRDRALLATAGHDGVSRMCPDLRRN